MASTNSQRRALGPLQERIRSAKVLLVGAGGIGCELLKNLTKSSFGEIQIIDLDTIDLSNLNRQFLFRNEHIKKSKALVAKEVAQKFNPKVKLVAHHANIKDAQFDATWFAGFDIVFNALDNLDARRHVNKMCLVADVPLIESGTTGFRGTAQVIKRGKTACYDCAVKETPKSFPICTIRSTPSQPIHCIVWAKSYLLNELFGRSEDESPEFDNSSNADNMEEIAKLKQESEALKTIRKSMGTDQFAEKVFDKVFNEDVQRLADMEGMWKGKRAPVPASWQNVSADIDHVNPTTPFVDQNVWTMRETAFVFRDSLQRLSKRLQDNRAAALKAGLPEPLITFDKDDPDTLDFVTAASNFRSVAFGIPCKSKFDVKQMAGNIIPAIATTNACTAAVCVLEAYKVLKNEIARSKQVYIIQNKWSATNHAEPSSDCIVCSSPMARLKVKKDATVGDLKTLLREKHEYGDSLNIVTTGALSLYDYLSVADEEEDEPGYTETLLQKKLSDFSVKSDSETKVGPGSWLIIQDDSDESPRVDLQLLLEAADEQDVNPVAIVLKGSEQIHIPRKPVKKEPEEAANGVMTEQTNGANGTGVNKRKRATDDDELEMSMAPIKKQQAASTLKTSDVVTIDDDQTQGAIVLDDDD